MQIIVGVYTAPETRAHWTGWIEPHDPSGVTQPSWIAFVDAAGVVSFYDRAPDGSIVDAPPLAEREGGQDQITLDLDALYELVNRARVERDNTAPALETGADAGTTAAGDQGEGESGAEA